MDTTQLEYAAYELIRLCQVAGGWAHYWRKPATSAWYPSGKPASMPAQWLDADLWFSVNAVNARNPRGAAHRVQNAHVDAVRVIYADVDAAGASMPMPPSVTVSSGRGTHAYWLLDTAIDAALAGELQYRWVHRCKADPAAVDLARVLRVPGSVNTKNDATVTVTTWQPHLTYTADDMLAECHDIAPRVRDVGKHREGQNFQAALTAKGADVVSAILRSKQGSEFTALYNGQHTYRSASEADAALCRLVSWWVDGDAGAMLAIWKTSALWREERCNDDYVQRTLAHGKTGVRNVATVGR